MELDLNESSKGREQIFKQQFNLKMFEAQKYIVAMTDTSKDWTQITIYIYIENLGNLNSFLSFKICWGLVWCRYDLGEKFFST